MAVEADNLDVIRATFVRSGFDSIRYPEETNLAAGGALWLMMTEHVRLVSVRVTSGGFTSSGGAVALEGTAAFEVINCVFEDNLAISDGGAIFFSSSGPLFIQDTILNRNRVERQIAVDQQIVVTVYTGGTGTGAQLRPLWKLDGDSPDPYTGQCGREKVYGNSTYDQAYEQDSTYAEVLTTRTGEHTLWLGVEVLRSSGFNSWEGGGWISITGILPKVFPTMCDNRARVDCPAPNNFARDPGCYNGEQTEQTNLIYCKLGETFWSSVSFTVPSAAVEPYRR